MVVHVKPVAVRELDFRPWRVAALVLIVDAASRARIDPDLVQALFGLSPAESKIAALLAAGRTLRQIAVETDRRYGTVRMQLKSIFSKLGASRQVEVVQTVLSLSELPRSRDDGD